MKNKYDKQNNFDVINFFYSMEGGSFGPTPFDRVEMYLNACPNSVLSIL